MRQPVLGLGGCPLALCLWMCPLVLSLKDSTSVVLANVSTSVVIKGCPLVLCLQMYPLVLSLGDVSTILVIVLCVFVIRGIFYQPGLLPFAMVRSFSTSAFTVYYSEKFLPVLLQLVVV